MMNAYQEKFYEFILARVKTENLEEVQSLLEESFAKQAQDNFDLEFLATFKAKLTPCLKPETKDEVLKIIRDFGQNFVR